MAKPNKRQAGRPAPSAPAPAAAAPATRNQASGGVRAALDRVGGTLGMREARRISNQYGVPLDRVARRAEKRGLGVRSSVYRNSAPSAPPAETPPPQDSGGPDYRSYFDDLMGRQEGFMSSLTDSFSSSLQGIVGQLGETLSSLKSNESEARAKAEAEQKKRDEDARQSAIDEQLQGLRSGSTVGGTPGSGLEGAGSLASGRGAYQRSFNSALDNYRRSLDPTDSVLDKDSGVEVMNSGGRRAQGERARQALARGSGARSYYSRRFG